MQRTQRLAAGLAGLGVVAALVGGATTWAIADGGRTSPTSEGSGRPPAAQADPSGAHTRLGRLTLATGDPVPAALETATPAQGTVALLAGPFDDRFRWHGVALARGRVTGSVRVTSDVSDLLELQVVAGFYDAQGRYLGLGRFTHHLDETGHTQHQGPPSEKESFTIAAPRAVRDRVASASVGVPVLVNE